MREELNEDIDKIDLKVPANPIPHNYYKRFRYKLEENSKIHSKRNNVLFLLGIGTGYRNQDIVDLTIGDIREALQNGSFLIQEKKQYNSWLKHIKDNPKSRRKKPNKRYAEIEPRSELEKTLKDYVKGKKNSEYAFPSNGDYGYITAKSFSRILKNIGEELGLENISGHSLRKTYATWLYEMTNDIVFVSKQLGHKSPETTMKYIGIDRKDKKRAAGIISSML
ncbi:tyrosine-type recombinase/integrase [Paraclostridium bifermentans]|uniref:tyrosine-type recombinase/integrase n=1 Tax=Paraclostridium bifermentans TaxID=1490 RepID=UPI00359C6512